MIAVTEIEWFIGDHLSREWKAAAVVDSSGRRQGRIFTGEDGLAFFVKYASGPDARHRMECEQDGLQILSQAIRTPDVVGVTGTDQDAALVLRVSPAREPTSFDWRQLGYAVAELHRRTQPLFGLDHDNYIGDFPQINTPSASWNEFYTTRRIAPMLRRARDRQLLTTDEAIRVDRLMQRIDTLSALDVTPSLLHGDFWKGNALFDKQGPLLIDPAVYYGNREVDLAFSKMATPLEFEPDFYDAYAEANPLPAGSEQRRDLCQLWPLLIHILQDGRQWVPHLMAAVGRYE